MSDLRTAARQALSEMANARDYIWLLDEGGTGVSEEEILNKLANAIHTLHAAISEPEERNFCPRCGKRTNDIHTCTPLGGNDVHS